MARAAIVVAGLAACAADPPAIEPACRCEDGAVGTYRCQEVNGMASCGCHTGVSQCPAFALEDCDGIDNDGNGVVDEREVCPDPSVTGTTSFTGGVYLRGTTQESQCFADAIQRFWPVQATAYLGPFNCTNRGYRFRRSDGALFSVEELTGLARHDAAGEAKVSTPWCPGIPALDFSFDFDARSTLYTGCGDAAYRGEGAIVAQPVVALAGVLDDGRSIVARQTPAGVELAVLDAEGHERSRLSPFADFAGELVAAPQATTVVGNRAYVAYLRRFPTHQTEIVVFRVAEDSTWSRVRRVPVQGFGSTQLALSDGTVLVRELDPLVPAGRAERIVAYLPDGTSTVAWAESAQQIVRADGHLEILIGPP